MLFLDRLLNRNPGSGLRKKPRHYGHPRGGLQGTEVARQAGVQPVSVAEGPRSAAARSAVKISRANFPRCGWRNLIP